MHEEKRRVQKKGENIMETTGHKEELGLLALALGSEEAAGRLLESFGDILQLERAGPEEVARRGNIATEKAQQLLASLVLGRHATLPSMLSRITYSRASDVVASFGALLASLDHESFFALLLDAKNRGIRTELIGRGKVTECDVSTREAFVGAIREGAASIVFMHNHPSGDPTPSPEDYALTSRLMAAGALLDIPVLDHIIIAREGFFSFAERKNT
jgi:DNA repair protein RadC